MARHLARSLLAVLMCFTVRMPMAAGEAVPLTGDQLDPAFLARCEANAYSLEQGLEPPPDDALNDTLYDALNDALADLASLDIVDNGAVAGMRAAFCPLKVQGGPLATTACAGEIILLDSGLAAADQRFALAVTLAHEITHVTQIRTAKAAQPGGYCNAGAFDRDAPGFEAEADRVSAQVRDLFVLGRAVDIHNQCTVPVRVFLELDHPQTGASGSVETLVLAPQSTARASSRALSRWVRFYASTDPANPPATSRAADKKIWQSRSRRYARFLEGRIYRFMREALPAAAPTTGPFLLTLSCTD